MIPLRLLETTEVLINSTPRNEYILTQNNIDNSVTNFNSVVERDFPASLVSDSFLFNTVTIPKLYDSQFYYMYFLLMKFIAYAEKML